MIFLRNANIRRSHWHIGPRRRYDPVLRPVLHRSSGSEDDAHADGCVLHPYKSALFSLGRKNRGKPMHS